MNKALLIADKRQRLLDKIVAFPQLIHSLMYEICLNLIKAVGKIMKLLCMMPVVAQHVCKKCKSLFRRRCRSVAV